MIQEAGDTLMTAMQTDRRPAIWPWLVMPLITLMLFYGLDRLYRSERAGHDLLPAPAVESSD